MKINSHKIFLINIIVTLISLLMFGIQKYIPEISTSIILIFLILFVVELCYWILDDYIMKISKKDIVLSVFGTFIIFVLMGCFIIWYLHTEKTIYTWDSCVYWIKGINLEKQAYSNLLQMFTSVRNGLGTQEYNDMAAIPLIPFIHVFGASFTKYVLYNYFLYYSPACIILSLFIVRIVESGKFSTYKYLFAYFITMSSPGLFLPLSNGYLDIIGILIIGLMLHTIFTWDYKTVKIDIIIKLSILSLLLLLSRRWYAFFIVGFYLAICIQFLIFESLSHKLSLVNCRNILINLLAIAGICSIVLLILSPEVFSLFLGNNYSNAYQAYKTRTFFADFYDIIKDYGFIFFLFSFLGIIIKIISEIRDRTNKTMLHLLFSTILTFFLFQKIQSMGEHHRYLMMPLFLVSVIFFIFKIENIISKKSHYLFSALIICLCGVNFLNSFYSESHLQTYLLSQIHQPPYIRNDLETINKMVDYFLSETCGTNQKIYIAVDSEEFSQELLNRSKLPEYVEAIPSIITANIKDTRDGFPSQAFLADYIVIAPTLYNDQAIISELTKIVQEQESNNQYQLVRQDIITNHTPILIYKKNNAISRSQVDALQYRLQKIYPDNKFVYQPDYFIALANLDIAENVEYYSWIDGYILTKSKEKDIQISYQLDKCFEEIAFTVTNWYPDCRIRVENDNIVIYDELISENGDTKYEFNITGVEKLKIIISSPQEQTITLCNGELR